MNVAKTNQTYILLATGAFLAVAAIGISALSSAQTANTLSCSVNAGSVNVNQAALITAVGGGPTYAWSDLAPGITGSAGNQFAVSYPSPGNYPITVASGGQTATCDVNVVGIITAGTLQCSPAVQNVMLGQTADVSVTGGGGTYAWSSPDLTIPNPTGSAFSENFPSVGLKVLTVASGNLVTNCVVNVLANSAVNSPVAAPTVIPGLPNTGGGYGY